MMFDKVYTLYILFYMETTIQKWGNSLGVRLPKSITDNKSLSAGTRVRVSEKEGVVQIEALPQTDASLEEMVSSITDDNKHAALSWGVAQGNEVW